MTVVRHRRYTTRSNPGRIKTDKPTRQSYLHYQCIMDASGEGLDSFWFRSDAAIISCWLSSNPFGLSGTGNLTSRF